ncbi:DUF2334 domain-containing protein [Paenibacillus chartarius]|uniref:DUF2334 domain-containing protein n=1 Tax=Paenibacillus chartarius TaxID=747481 RepID=A0ABV6DM56_9BACL
MKRRWWIRAAVGAAVLLLGTGAAICTVTFTGANSFPNVNKRHAMLRLEDIGPGGAYGSLEGLGKLRAVLDFIKAEQIPYHIAVIPRMMSTAPDGSWRERGIDDPNPDFVTASLVRLLQESQRSGGVLGMHGYSHQAGESARPDDGHVSGTGAEFKVKEIPETYEADYAAERIRRSFAAFAGAGLRPAFWESPHYDDTREQERVFRSYIGLLYQPDLFSLRSFKDLTAYDSVNSYEGDSLGSVYIPAPFKYVSDEASVDRKLDQAAKDNGLASLYFHPFLEFSHLEQATSSQGMPLEQDGLPLYRYKPGAEASPLHRLLSGFRQQGYRWMSLHDIVPFTPAHRVTLPPGTKADRLLFGDVTGGGHADVVVREEHRILVIPGTYTGPRNRPQEASEVWLKAVFAPEEELLLYDVNGDGRDDLLANNRSTGEARAALAEDRRFAEPSEYKQLPASLTGLVAGAGRVGKAVPPALPPSPRPTGSVQGLEADTNSDGRADWIEYEAAAGVWRIYEQTEDGQFRQLDNDFGPWAQGKERIAFTADFDGNGKSDIASFDENNHVLDIALSFRGHTP